MKSIGEMTFFWVELKFEKRIKKCKNLNPLKGNRFEKVSVYLFVLINGKK